MESTELRREVGSVELSWNELLRGINRIRRSSSGNKNSHIERDGETEMFLEKGIMH